jgi:signal transduction histidine kinase
LTTAQSGLDAAALALEGKKPLSLLDLAIADLSANFAPGSYDIGRFRASQLRAVGRLSPFMLAGNIGAAILFAWLAFGQFNQTYLAFWASSLIVVSALLLMSWARNRRRTFEVARSSVILRAEVYAGVLGLIWAAFPALFFEAAPSDFRIFIVAVLLAAAGMGAFGLARIPSAAIIFSLTIAGSLAMAAFRLGGTLGTTFAFMSLAYGFMMTVMILIVHRSAVERAVDAHDIARQREIISLLLKDFERGASDWLWETDAAGRLIYFSNRFAELLKRDPERLRGATLRQAAGATVSHAGWLPLDHAMAAGDSVVDLHLETSPASGTRWWRVSARPLTGPTGAIIGYRGVGKDVTAERAAQDQLLKAKEEAEKSSAAKSQFLAIMSHELKTPLNAITGFAQMLADAPELGQASPKHAGYARTILHSSLHLRLLIDDVLDVTRIERGTLTIAEQEADMAEIAEIAVKMCREAAAASDVGVIAELPSGIGFKGDITRLKQVIINLVTNAIKFSPAGGQVSVCFERPADGGLVIAVEDHGCGIAEADLERIFEPFVQADGGIARRFGGIGLGLSISRRIAELHGGRIAIDSKLGEGTTARVVLPANRIIWPEEAAA